jgi:hypothetical protein
MVICRSFIAELAMPFGDLLSLNKRWQFGNFFIAKYTLAIRRHKIAKCTLAIW